MTYKLSQLGHYVHWQVTVVHAVNASTTRRRVELSCVAINTPLRVLVDNGASWRELLTLQPHASRLQRTSSWQTVPAEVTANTVDVDGRAASEPEPTAVHLGTVLGADVVVSVVRCEHHPVVQHEWILPGVAWVATHMHKVVDAFTQHDEGAVLGVVPHARGERLEFKLEFIAAAQRELMQQFVAEPVVACRVVEADFELVPRTVEEVHLVVDAVDVLLDQQWDAPLYASTTQSVIDRSITLDTSQYSSQPIRCLSSLCCIAGIIIRHAGVPFVRQ